MGSLVVGWGVGGDSGGVAGVYGVSMDWVGVLGGIAVGCLWGEYGLGWGVGGDSGSVVGVTVFHLF